MKWMVYHLKMLILFSGIWIILEEELSPVTVLSGALIGLATLVLTDRYVLRADYQRRYSLGFLVGIRYIASLIFQIYVAGFQAVYRMITRRLNVDVVEITTSLTNDFHISLLANSITLTPGTVTIDRRGNRLRIIWIDCVTKDPAEAGRRIKLNFERLLSGGKQ